MLRCPLKKRYAEISRYEQVLVFNMAAVDSIVRSLQVDVSTTVCAIDERISIPVPLPGLFGILSLRMNS